jgi:hypothetical protein
MRSHTLRAHLRNHAYGIVAILIALGGTAYAATSFVSANGTVRGCVSKKGQLTVLKKSAKKCAKGLTLITWNQKGPAGQTGAQGSQGGQGLKGDQGDPGPATGPASGDLTGNYPAPSIAAGAVTDAKVAAANKDGLANVPSLRTLGTGASQAMPGNATPGGPPTGAAGGALAGTYPNPTLNVTGGPCATGQFLTNLSNLSAQTCGPVGSITALGEDALGSNVGGIANSAVGQNALGSNTSGGHNSALGQSALQANTVGGFNSAVGVEALSSNLGGTSNTAVGYRALHLNTTGLRNSAVGENALNANTANENSALGDDALKANTSGAHNSAFGQAALTANDTGADNSAFGQDALHDNTTGASNVAVGQGALTSNTGGGGNTALGTDALDGKTSGANNVAVGKNAGGALGTGSNNALFGTDAGSAFTANDGGNVAIANVGVAGESNTIRIGTQGTQTGGTFLAGVSGGPSLAGSQVLVDANGKLGTAASSRRFKTRIRPLGSLDKLMKLRPVSFRYKPKYADHPNRTQFGLIAEEVAKVFPNLVVNGRDGKPYTVAYQQLPVLLLAQLQREHTRVGHQHRQINRQQRRNNRQQRQIDRLEAQVRKLARRR